MNYRYYLCYFFVFITSLGATSQNKIVAEDIMALKRIEAPSFTVVFEYNQYGWVTSETRKGIENEYFNYKYEYEYDENGNITLLLGAELYFTRKEENVYNADNQIIEKKIYEDYGSGFKYLEWHFYIYKDAQLQTVLQQLITPNGPRDNIKREFIYNDARQLVQIATYELISGNWLHTEIYDFEYNSYGYLLHYSHETLQWEEFSKIERYVFYYNDEGELTERSYHSALGSDWNPRPLQRYLYYYEPLKEDNTILFPNIYKFDDLNLNWFLPDKKLIKDDFWLADCGGTLYFVESANYFYDVVTINTDIVETRLIESLQVYPNPTTGKLQIMNYELGFEDIEIFDVYGRKMSSHHTTPLTSHSSSVIDISHLPAGIYFLRTIVKNEFLTQKIIKL